MNEVTIEEKNGDIRIANSNGIIYVYENDYEEKMHGNEYNDEKQVNEITKSIVNLLIGKNYGYITIIKALEKSKKAFIKLRDIERF